MAITVLQRPQGYILGDQYSGSIDNVSSQAVVASTAHGLVDGDYVYIKSISINYNGFWYVDKINDNNFAVRQNQYTSNIAYVNSDPTAIYYKIAVIHGIQCVHLPIIYKLSNDLWPTNSVDTVRTISTVTNSNGYCAIATSGDIKATGSAAALEYIVVTNSGTLDGVYQIVTYTNDQTFVINLTYSSANDTALTGASIQYYYNNYCIKIKVYAGITSDHTYYAVNPISMISELRLIPDSDGDVVVSVNEILKSEIRKRNELLLSTLPNNTDFWTSFYITYAESHDDSDGSTLSTFTSSYTDDSSNFTGMAVNAKLPFKNIHSGHLSEYIFINPNYDSKFLTLFSDPVIFSGKYFDLSFIARYGYYNSFELAALSNWVNNGSGISWTLSSTPSVVLLGAETSKKLIGAVPSTDPEIFYGAFLEINVTSASISGDTIFFYLLDSSFSTVYSASSLMFLSSGVNYFNYSILGSPTSAYFGFTITNGEAGSRTFTINNVRLSPIDDDTFAKIILNQNNAETELDITDEGVYRIELSDPNCDNLTEDVQILERKIAYLGPPAFWTNSSTPDTFDVKDFTSLQESFDMSATYAGAYINIDAISSDNGGVNFQMPITVVLSGTWTIDPGNFLTVTVYLLSTTTVRGLHTFEYTTNGTYNENVDITLAEGTPNVNRIEVQFDYSFLGSGSGTVEIILPEYYFITPGSPQLSKTLTVDCSCLQAKHDGVYLTWLNYLGGFDYWWFKSEQVHEINVISNGTNEINLFESWPNSYGEFSDTIEGETFRDAKEVKTLRTQLLTTSQMEGLKYIRISSLVQILNSKYDRRTVLVDVDSFVFRDEGNNYHTMSFKITYTDKIPVQS